MTKVTKTFVIDGITYSAEGSRLPTNTYKPISIDTAVSFATLVEQAKRSQKTAAELKEAIEDMRIQFEIVGIE